MRVHFGNSFISLLLLHLMQAAARWLGFEDRGTKRKTKPQLYEKAIKCKVSSVCDTKTQRKRHHTEVIKIADFLRAASVFQADSSAEKDRGISTRFDRF